MHTGSKRRLYLQLIMVLGTMFLAGGCINLAANLIHAVQGDFRPAEFDGLKKKRVALICTTDTGLGNDATNSILTSNFHAALGMNVDDIELVRNSEIEQWLDVHGWDEADYVEIGKGVKADLVLAIEVLNLRLKNGQTLYRGQADITATVYDVAANGKILYRKQMPEFAFPEVGGKPVTETTDNKFRSFFLAVVTRKVASLFYEVEATADYALDATISSF